MTYFVLLFDYGRELLQDTSFTDFSCAPQALSLSETASYSLLVHSSSLVILQMSVQQIKSEKEYLELSTSNSSRRVLFFYAGDSTLLRVLYIDRN